MIKRLLSWIKKRQTPKLPPSMEEDPMMAEAIMRCWSTGKMIIGNRDKEGNVTITEHETEASKRMDKDKNL